MEKKIDLINNLKDNNFHIPDWLYNSLKLRNPIKDHSLRGYYDFIINESIKIDGDIAEFGVFRGDSTITTALLLKRMKSKKKVYGFDTFSGFPKYHKNDNFKKFKELFKNGNISKKHYENVLLLKEAEKLKMYSQHQFTDTSFDFVQKRIKSFKLNNINLIKGPFKETISSMSSNIKFSCALLDCDLYESYKDVLTFLWDRMSPGGFIYLDEYYSLKYPGSRIAVNEFCNKIKINPERILAYAECDEFERWYLKKLRC